MTTEKSLVRFVLERVESDLCFAMRNTPVVFGGDVRVSPEIRSLLADRDLVLKRTGGLREIVAETVAAMVEEQEQLVIHDRAEMPVTRLGETILKLLAERHADHADFDPSWSL